MCSQFLTLPHPNHVITFTDQLRNRKMVAENSSADLAQRMKRLQSLMVKSAKTQSTLQVCGASKWKGSSHIKKMRKSALTRRKLLQGITTSENDSTSSIAPVPLMLECANCSPISQHRRTISDPVLSSESCEIQKPEQQLPLCTFLNAQYLRSLVESYQRSKSLANTEGEQQPRCLSL